MKAIIKMKEDHVNEISDLINQAKSFILFEYQGLNAAHMTELRSKLKSEGSQLFVLKNNIIKRAFEKSNIKNFEECYTGPNALAIGSEDELSVFKNIYDIKKEFDFINIKGGYFDGNFADVQKITTLATIPSREGLYSMVLSCLTAPIRNVLYALKAVQETKN